MNKALAALLVALASSPFTVGCGARDGHEVRSGQPANFVVFNYDHHHELDVHMDKGTLGTISDGRMAYYLVRPGLRHAWIKADDGSVLDLGETEFTYDKVVTVNYFSFYATPPPPPDPEPASSDDDEDDPDEDRE